MMNMGYCRFENTFFALEECVDALVIGEDISDIETKYAEKLKEKCEKYLEEYNEFKWRKEV